MKKKKILGLIIGILTAVVLLLQCYIVYEETGKVDANKITEAVETIVNAIENESTTEIPDLKQDDEQTLEVQEEILTEEESLKEQGEIAYNGDYLSENVKLGEYAGLTYYSQVDSRWKNHPYTSISDNSQTVGTSGCGPTSAAMIVSSIRGTITPNTMANLFVANGYRSSNSGTYLSAFRWTADFFNIEYEHTKDLNRVVELLKDNNYIIASCGSGLFTYGGHIIVIYGAEDNNLKIYDPYLYNGKFDTSTRRGKVSIKNNTVYCSIDNFRRYANATNFYGFKNDRKEIKENTTTTTIKENTSNITNTNYKVVVTAKNGLNIRSGANIKYSRLGGYTKNTIVTINSEINNWGKTNLGWICLDYTRKIVSEENKNTSNYILGLYKVNAKNGLNVRTGPGTQYRRKKLYVNGTRFDTYEIKNNWARTPSGWVCLDYCNLVRKY